MVEAELGDSRWEVKMGVRGMSMKKEVNTCSDMDAHKEGLHMINGMY
jgi:hypothetical protein